MARSTRKHEVARRAASYKANRLADAIRYLRAARAEADAAGFDLGARGDEREMLAALAVQAEAAGFDASEFLGEDA